MKIKELRERARISSCEASLKGEIEKVHLKETVAGKPFYEVVFRDASDSLVLRAWSDKPAFVACQKALPHSFIRVTGTFSHGSFGLDASHWNLEPLSEEEISLLLEGSAEERDAHQAAYQIVLTAVAQLQDCRLQQLCEQFLNQYGARFRRAAAARSNHHARRGGLLDHTSRMIQAAQALLNVYPHLHADLLITGTLFHDVGKLWETCPPPQGFTILPDMRGELMGHLSIGIEMVNALWRELPKEGWELWTPSSEELRLHLIHLIAAHHGQLEFGSPILPKTPEAIALHLIDNLDARLEMFEEAYAKNQENSPGIFEWSRPLGVAPLAQLGKSFKKESIS
jgi:3'-5' exoribonuclease